MEEVLALLGMPSSAVGSGSLLRGLILPAPEQIGDRAYINLPERGLSLALNEDAVVIAIQLFSEGHEGFSEWAGPLPGDLTFQDGRAAVRHKLGAPDQAKDERKVPILGDRPAFDLFKADEHQINVQYRFQPDDSIQLISIFGSV